MTDRPRITAQLSLPAERNGGRRASISNDYRAHVLVDGIGEFLGVRTTRMEAPLLAGSTGLVELEFLYHPDVDYSPLQPGIKFTMQEGPIVVAEGQVVQGVQL
jgi:hypothetical protein